MIRDQALMIHYEKQNQHVRTQMC